MTLSQRRLAATKTGAGISYRRVSISRPRKGWRTPAPGSAVPRLISCGFAARGPKPVALDTLREALY